MLDIGQESQSCAIHCRRLSTLEDCAAVAALEREIWGPNYDQAIPIAMLVATAARGAILLGAFDEHDRMIGFVYSLCGVKNGRTTQWSYKLGVAERFRNAGTGMRLKLLQRELALAMGAELIEWSFDPMLAANAHLNLNKLGATAEEYREDFYGQSLAPIAQRSLPTDRLIARWNVRAGHKQQSDDEPASQLDGRNDRPVESTPAAPVNQTIKRGEWLQCSDASLDSDAERILIEIPTDFHEMVLSAPAAALAWRLKVRQLFTTYFKKRYRAVEFVVDRSRRIGAYLLVRREN